MSEEDKQSDLPNRKGSEIRVKPLRRGVAGLSNVSLQNQVDDRFLSSVASIRFVFRESLIQLATDVLVHLSPIPPFYDPSNEIEMAKWVRFCVWLMPPDLPQHAVGENIVAFLSP